MTHRIAIAALIFIFGLSPAFAGTIVRKAFLYSEGTFTVLEIPGTIDTYPRALNDLGQVVGFYVTDTGYSSFVYQRGVLQTIPTEIPQDINNRSEIVGLGRTSGFHYQGGTLTILQVPGSTQTYARAVNNLGQIAGGFTLNGTFPYHPFVYSGGTFKTFDPPGNPANTVVQGINDAGQILGYFVENSTSGLTSKGFIYADGKFTMITVPGSRYATTRAINGTGQVIGNFLNLTLDRSHAFLYTGGSVTTIDVPGSPYTEPADINGAGDIVGAFFDPAASTYHGFLYKNGTFSTLSVPGSIRTDAVAINNLGQIVGTAEFYIPDEFEFSF